jgi:hypothetical protein
MWRALRRVVHRGRSLVRLFAADRPSAPPSDRLGLPPLLDLVQSATQRQTRSLDDLQEALAEQEFDMPLAELEAELTRAAEELERKQQSKQEWPLLPNTIPVVAPVNVSDPTSAFYAPPALVPMETAAQAAARRATELAQLKSMLLGRMA